MSEAERIEWEARYVEGGARVVEPEPFIVSAVSGLVLSGSAVDLAGGTGRHAIWLSGEGWDTTLVDISAAALTIAASMAAARGVPLRTQQTDLDERLPQGGPFDLAIAHHYVNRSLLAQMAAVLSPGGHLVMAHPTVTNLERNDRPGRKYLLGLGELPSLLVDTEVVSYFEGWTDAGRHEAQVVAERPR